MTIQELRDARAQSVNEGRAILARAEGEKREPTTDETRQFDESMKKSDELAKQIETAEAAEDRSARLAAADNELTISRGRRTQSPPVTGTGTQTPLINRASAQYAAAFRSFLQGGTRGMSREQREVAEHVMEESRILVANQDAAGAYLILPEQFQQELIKFVENIVFIRKLSTVYQVPNAQSLGIPSIETDIDDYDWTSELLTGNLDAGLAFGKRELFPHPLAKRILLSNKLLRQAALAESVTMEKLAYKIGVTQEKAFMTGTGAQQPLGVFTASAQGISTGQDFTCGSASAIAADDLIGAKYNLKQQYMQSKSLRWVFNRILMKDIRKLKDSNNQYLWQPSGLGTNLSVDGIDQILNVPTIMSEYAPSTKTTGLYIGIIGDFRFYYIADALNMTVQRLDEVYAEVNQTAFLARMETDAMPVLEEAFTRLKLA